MRAPVARHGIVAIVGATLLGCRAGPDTRAPRQSIGPATTIAANAVPDWRPGATCYEIFVRSFQDGDGDGVGDLRGLTARLDYINDGDPRTTTDLGARCIWLMPVNDAASYHGYDATDYYRIDPDYGTNDDFTHFVAEAHRRGIAVFVDMVLNHLSSEHPYFRDALGGPGAAHRSWFRFSPTKPSERGPWGQEVWHRSPVRDEYYYGVFWHGMPDLDYHTPAVREEAKKIAAFWLTEMGVDGFRLDAVPYLVEEGNDQIGTAGTHAFLREYAAAIKRIAPAAFTVGEVWDGIDRMLPYYPDQLESYFAFDLSDAMIDAVRTGSAHGLLDRFARYQREVPDQRFSTFLRNHDQRRTLTALGGDVAKARLAASLLLTLPGLPFVYYGEEIGMTGDKPDERLRTPMQWTSEASAGFTTGTPWEALQPDLGASNVARETNDPRSLLSRYRRLIRLRQDHPALGAGDFAPLQTGRDDVIAYLRRSDDRVVLVVANLGSAAARGVVISSAGAVAGPGSYAARDLLDARPIAGLTIAADGRIRDYVPAATIAPLDNCIIDLAKSQ